MSRKIAIAFAAAFACAPMSAALAASGGNAGSFEKASFVTGHHGRSHFRRHNNIVSYGRWGGYGWLQPDAAYYACYPGNYQYGAPWHKCGYTFDWNY